MMNRLFNITQLLLANLVYIFYSLCCLCFIFYYTNVNIDTIKAISSMPTLTIIKNAVIIDTCGLVILALISIFLAHKGKIIFSIWFMVTIFSAILFLIIPLPYTSSIKMLLSINPVAFFGLIVWFVATILIPILIPIERNRV